MLLLTLMRLELRGAELTLNVPVVDEGKLATMTFALLPATAGWRRAAAGTRCG
jgi:hypothetical protein